MTRFLYIADTHWGSGDTGYRLQPRYADRLPEILAGLKSWIRANGPVEFVLHGGDMVHELSLDNLRAARPHFDLKVPVHLCVGNHDLTVADGIGQWLGEAPEFFIGGSPNYLVTANDCNIHVVPNHYDTEPYFWSEKQDIHLLDTQISDLKSRLEAEPGTAHIILTHSPVLPVPPDQTGIADPFHAPPQTFTDAVTSLAESCGVTCVLGAHSHANMNKELNGVNYVTVSSLVESPFEFKLFEVDRTTLSMTTHNLGHCLDFPADYNFDQTFVQGRACDRSFTKSL